MSLQARTPLRSGALIQESQIDLSCFSVFNSKSHDPCGFSSPS